MSSTQHPLPPKKEVALALLERSSVHIHLDPRQEGVVVPPWFRKQAQLVLQIGLNMPVPIPDLRLDDDGMSCTLSFNRSPFFCVVPWTSVFAMVGEDKRGMVWPDDVPPEIAGLAGKSEPAPKTSPKRVALAAAPAPPPSSPAASSAPSSKSESPKSKRPRKKPAAAAVEREAPRAVPQPVARPVAVPAPAPSSPAIASESAPAAASRSPNAAPRKPKRELPPYLRVVK